MNQPDYAIWHKDRQAWFAGFSEDGDAIWSDRAKPMTRLKAECQSALFIAMDERVQRKPVQIGEQVELATSPEGCSIAISGSDITLECRGE